MLISPSLKELVKCRWREFCREPSALYWVIFMPIFWMAVLGSAFSGDKSERFGIGILRNNVSEAVSKSIDDLKQSNQLQITEGPRDELATLMVRGDIVLLIQAEPDGIRYAFDQTNPAAKRARALVDDLLQRAAGRLDVLTTQNENIQAPGSRYVDFLIPGLLALSIMSTSLFGVAMTIVSNRKENILKLFMVTPMRSFHYLLSHIVGRMLSLTVEFTTVLFAGWLIFGFKVSGNMIEFALLSILGAAAFTAIAMACASRTKSIPMISGITNLLMIFMVMMSGVFFAKTNFPDWMQSFINFLPLTALVDGLRRIALEGSGLVELRMQIGMLIGYSVLGFAITRLRFRWY